MLDYIKTGTAQDSYTRKLESAVYALNADDDWRDKFMTFEMKLKERERLGHALGVEEGREEGLKEGRKEGIKEGLEKGISIKLIQLIKNIITNSIPLDTALPILGEDAETIKPIYDLILEKGTDYDDEELVRMIVHR